MTAGLRRTHCLPEDSLSGALRVCAAREHNYLGMYRTLSATTKPTLKKRLLAGMNGNTRNSRPANTSLCSSL